MRKISSLWVVASGILLCSISASAEVNYDVSWSAAGYRVDSRVSKTKTGLEVPLTLNDGGSTNFYGKTIRDLVVSVDYETSDRLHVKIADKDGKQIAVPDETLALVRPKIHSAAKDRNYEFKYTKNPFGFQVIRNSDQQVVFDTTQYPLVFEDQYLELTTAVPNNTNIYGFGETTLLEFRRNNIKNATTIFARDAATPFFQNIYGAHPFYMEIRDGKAHGALLVNAHGMDVMTVEGRITYKVIGGILEFYFFVPDDNKPNGVSKAYTDLVGKPMMPAHWMLGWNQCRWGYKNIDEVEYVIKEYKKHNIPLETAWIDIDYMDTFKDFTCDPVNFPEARMKALSDQLHADGQKFVVIVDPAIGYYSDYEAYQHGKELDVFIKLPNGSDYYVGEVWPGYTVFPDWWHPNASKYWSDEIAAFMKRVGLDGLWIDMNEPSSFCIGSCGSGKLDVMPPSLEPWNLPQDEQDKMTAEQNVALNELAKTSKDPRNLLYPPYAINTGYGNLSVKTVAMIAPHYNGIPHYDIHNLYGHAESSVTRDAILKYNSTERTFVLSRSTFSGSGQYAGHWTGDNYSLWAYLKSSLTEIFYIQMFGITLSGADICGFNSNTTEQLCTRWQEIGSFYPFARNHNAKGNIPQEPFRWNSTAEATRKALAIRYALLPYYYTLFEESHRVGTAVWRPLIFEYPTIDAFLDNSDQVLVGSDILLSPVLYENATSVDAQFPPGLWYDWYTHDVQKGSEDGEKVTLDAPLTHIPVHIRGGAIVPLKTPQMTVDTTYATPYSLLVALDENGEAAGRLYIDDGHSIEQPHTSDIHFTYKNGKLSAEGRFDYSKAEKLGCIKLVGKQAAGLTTAKYRGHTYDLKNIDGAVVLENVDIDLTSGAFTVQFDY